ncbi:MAG: crotonase/enoyl-CoA hydratase family protein [Actinomycetota bacterium]|nr:crotonase/enoyl-CoA hydratase family protein [Actinomycetota bacterium]
MGYEHIEVTQDGHVATLWLNRPEKRNAMSEDMWADIPAAMAALDADSSVRVIVLAARGPAFSVGIDINMLMGLQPSGDSQAAANMQLYEKILELQQTISCFADSPKPVIAAIHGYCLGAGVDLITACDIRLAAADAVFSVRETKVGLVADVGSLQRLPAIVGPGVTAEMAFTGGDYEAAWAKAKGLVNDVYDDYASLEDAVSALAHSIAANSPLVIQGIKRVLAAAEGRTVEEALDYVAQWNSSFLLSNDLMEAMAAFVEKRDANYTGT